MTEKKNSPAKTSRRHFIQSAGTAAATTLLATTGNTPAAEPTGSENLPDPPPDVSIPLKPTGADMGSLFRDIWKLAEANRHSYSFLTDRFKSLEEFQRAGREKVFEALLYRPEKVDPQPEVLDRADMGDYIREKILFSTSKYFRVPCYVLIPKRVDFPAPAIVDLHSHGGKFIFGKEKVIDLGKGKNHPMMETYHDRNYGGRPTATELVRRGYVVISIDAFMFGERRLLMDADLEDGWQRSDYSLETALRLNQKCRGKESTLCKSLSYAGISWPGIVHWDDIRTVDYLVTRPEVDGNRIGCHGISMGGYRTVYLAGLDPRIKIANVVGFMSTTRKMVHNKIDTHSWVHFPPGVHQYLDLPDVVSMMAPKPLIVQQCRQDGLFTEAGMQESLDRLRAVYKKAGCEEKFYRQFYEERHRYTVPMQNDAFALFDKYLKA